MKGILLPRKYLKFPLVKVIVSKIAHKSLITTKNVRFLRTDHRNVVYEIFFRDLRDIICIIHNVFIALLKKFLHHLKVGGNPFWGNVKWHFFEISKIKKSSKKSKFFCSKFSSDCFHVFPGDSSTPKHLFFWSMSRQNPKPFKIISRK